MIPFMPPGVLAGGAPDPTILWDSTQITDTAVEWPIWGDSYAYFYFPATTSIPMTYTAARYTPEFLGLAYEPTIDSTYSAGEYLIKYDVVSVVSGSEGVTINGFSGQEGVWFDLVNAEIGLLDITDNGVPEVQIIDVTIATDNGSGSPVPGTSVTKRCTLRAYTAPGEFQVYDAFTVTSDMALNAHTPNNDQVGTGWSYHAGGFTILNGIDRVVGTDASDNRAIIDSGEANTVVGAAYWPYEQDIGVLARVQDANNYWLLMIADSDTADPVFQMVEVNAGTPTVRASMTLIGEGPFGTIGGPDNLEFILDGDDLYGLFYRRAANYRADDSLRTLSYTSSFLNTETVHGIACYGNASATTAGILDFWISTAKLTVGWVP